MTINKEITDEDGELKKEIRHLITRDVQLIEEFPDRIFALGGGGRKMVLEMFSQDWFAVEVMKSKNNDVDVVFLDTATEQEQNYESQTEELKKYCENLSQKIQDETPAGTSIARINIKDIIITESIRINDYASLIGNQSVNNIKETEQIDYWWVEKEHLDAVDGSNSFYQTAAGAVKRRALGKALHYKSFAEGDQAYKTELDNTKSQDKVALFTGLGGGTGSGTVIDVAQYIESVHQDININLFASMPSPTQMNKAKSNAFAALSELEYMQLNKDTPFNQIFLFPLAPVKLESERTEGPGLDEFDRSLCYAVVGAYTGVGLDYALTDTKRYSPFTIVIPQVLHYNLEEIKQRKSDLHSVLIKKRKLMNLEYTFFDTIEKYLEEQYGNTNKASSDQLGTETREYIISRLEQFEKLMNSELLEKLDIGLGGVELEKVQQDVMKDIYGDDLDSDKTRLSEIFRTRALDEVMDDLRITINDYNIEHSQVNQYSEFDEDFVQDIIFTEMHNMIRNFDILCRLRGAEQQQTSADLVGTDADTKILKIFLLPHLDRTDERNRRRTLRSALENTDENINEKEGEIDSVKNNRDDEKRRLEDAQQNAANKLITNCSGYITDYERISEVDISSERESIENTLRDFAAEISGDSDPSIRGTKNEIDEQMDKIETKLQDNLQDDFDNEINISGLRERLKTNIDVISDMKKYWIQLEADNNNTGLFGGVKDVLSNNGNAGQLDTTQYDNARAKLDDDLFSVSNSPNRPDALGEASFNARYVGELKERMDSSIEDKKSKLKTEIAREYEQVVDSIDHSGSEPEQAQGVIGQADSTQSDGKKEIRSFVENETGTNIKNRLIEKIKNDIKGKMNTDYDRYQRKIEKLESDLATLKEKKSRLQTADEARDELVSESGQPVRRIYNEFIEDFETELLDLPHGPAGHRHKIDGEYEHQVTPADLSSAIKQKSLIDSGLLASRAGREGVSEERDSVRKSVESIINNKALTPTYHGLINTNITSADRDSFPDTGVYVSFAGEAVDSSNQTNNKLGPDDFERVGEILQRNFALGGAGAGAANQYDEWFVSNGDPWEISVCVFIQGISFLDNLRHVFGAVGGYWPRYQDFSREHSTTQALARHAYGLGNGYYPRRKTHIDVNGRPELFVDNKSEDVTDELLSQYEKVSINDKQADDTANNE